MSKKSKTKKATKSSGQARSAKSRVVKYSVQHLAIILACFLILEGLLFGVSAGSDWQRATTLLDVSDGVSETVNDMSVTFQPVVEVVESVELFYQLSATEMMYLLDLSDSGIGSEISFFYNGVSDFYQEASVQMAGLLNIYNNFHSMHGKIAGASIEN